jgi:HEAT repeat protein
MNTSLASFLACALISFAGLSTGCGDKQGASGNLATHVQALKSPESDAKVNALTELAKAGPAAASATAQIIPLLTDKDPLVRRLAAYALGQIGPEAASALPSLRQALNDSDPEVVSDAVIALRSIGDTNANVVLPNVTTPPTPQ